MVAEVIGGLLSDSLALLADAGHMVTDAAAIGLALLAIWISARPASARRSFGFQRTEVLAALFNALSLWLIAAWIFLEAYRRFQEPPEVRGSLMLSVGLVGLFVNLLAAMVLRRSAGESLNAEGAFIHVLGDLLGSIAVVAGGVLIIALGWYLADPLFGVIIGILILVTSTRLIWRVVHVLLEGTPAHVDVDRLCRQLELVEGVTGVHDLHVWSLTTGYELLSAHVTSELQASQDREHLLQHLREVAAREYGIAHITIQLEDSEKGCQETHHIDHSVGPMA
jgi:cobalt-zinc-cadmium efflux system protein